MVPYQVGLCGPLLLLLGETERHYRVLCTRVNIDILPMLYKNQSGCCIETTRGQRGDQVERLSNSLMAIVINPGRYGGGLDQNGISRSDKKEASFSICLLSNSLLSDLNVSCDGKRGVKDNAMFLT